MFLGAVVVGTNGYVPLRRGLLPHIRTLSGGELSVYIALLLMADPSSGPHSGCVAIGLMDLVEITGFSKPTVAAALRALSVSSQTRPAYISYEPAQNQFGVTKVRILKYRRAGKESLPPALQQPEVPDKNLYQQPYSSLTAALQHTTSEQGKQAANSHESHDSHEKNNPLEDDAPKSVTLYVVLLKVWERVTMSVPSEASKRALRGMAEMGYSEPAVESALKVAVENHAKSPADYAKKVLMNGSMGKEFTPDGFSVEALRGYDNA